MARRATTAIVQSVTALSAACATSPARSAPDGPRGDRNGAEGTKIKPYSDLRDVRARIDHILDPDE